MIFGTGAVPCKYDPLDKGFTDIGIGSVGDVNLESDLTKYVKKVRNQGSSPTCGGQAFAGAIDVVTSQSIHKNDYQEPASALFLYYLAIRRAYGEPLEGMGIDARSVCKVLQKQGTCDESLWPFKEDKVLSPPGWDAIFSGAARSGCSYAFIRSQDAQRIGEIAAVLRFGIPVVVRIDLGPAFKIYSSGVIEEPTGDIWGRHFLLLVARALDGRFKALNSWGSWGLNGYCWLSDQYIGGQYCGDPCAVYGFDRARER
jgi:hypothetical protein